MARQTTTPKRSNKRDTKLYQLWWPQHPQTMDALLYCGNEHFDIHAVKFHNYVLTSTTFSDPLPALQVFVNFLTAAAGNRNRPTTYIDELKSKMDDLNFSWPQQQRLVSAVCDFLDESVFDVQINPTEVREVRLHSLAWLLRAKFDLIPPQEGPPPTGGAIERIVKLDSRNLTVKVGVVYKNATKSQFSVIQFLFENTSTEFTWKQIRSGAKLGETQSMVNIFKTTPDGKWMRKELIEKLPAKGSGFTYKANSKFHLMG